MSKSFWDSTPRHFPTQDELAALDRDLRFHPARETAGKRLTVEQRQSYNREGYLLPFRVFSDAEIERLRSRFDGWLEEAQRQGADSYSIVSAHMKHGIVWDLLRDRRITACVGDILGSDFICWGAHFFCKMPGDGKRVSWHQDASYWPLTPSKTVSVWLAVDRADRENACMQFVAGSHLHGHLDFVRSAESEANILNQTVPEAERFGHGVVDVELEAGEYPCTPTCCCTARPPTFRTAAAAASPCATPPPRCAPSTTGTPRASSSAAATRAVTGPIRRGRRPTERR